MNIENFKHFDKGEFKRFVNPAILEKDLRTLVGLISGIESDGQINEQERQSLLGWISQQKIYSDRKPYNEIIRVLQAYMSDGILTGEESENIKWFCEEYINKTGYYSAISAGIQELTAIMQGIHCDKAINDAEIRFLDIWIEENSYLRNTYPYDEVYNLITKVLSDNLITEEEQKELLHFFRAVSGDVTGTEHNQKEMVAALKTGFFQIDPEIRIPENTFCITGISKRYNRRQIAEKIELYGGYVADTVSAKINYLVVCDEKNECWAFTCYGKKIEAAMKHRKKGNNIAIVHEFDLYDTLENL